MENPAWDTLIRNALVFDGTGSAPAEQDIAIKGGRIAARGSQLPIGEAVRVIEGAGQWLLPGLLDIHTHLDLEVDLEPGLPEVVRHGTTTVLVGNCSLGTCLTSALRRCTGITPAITWIISTKFRWDPTWVRSFPIPCCGWR
jgi:N-acyl-D-aspartate/D-glutamate deacylase